MSIASRKLDRNGSSPSSAKPFQIGHMEKGLHGPGEGDRSHWYSPEFQVPNPFSGGLPRPVSRIAALAKNEGGYFA
ncbi:unnamed protein product [Soboliphyme baturini]|uniref:SoHo domain-containing protein n=1 Tax=Soboliphyme baturini TaxID=241478 RepID=A0A183IAW4_9BILA|nr:unnamed protein product [Soboliphyme baturini]